MTDPEPDEIRPSDRARSVADRTLFPSAQDVDRGLRRPHDGLRALADARLFGIAGPISHGGSDVEPNESRRTIAAVGSGCGATFFVWVQHHGVVRTLRSSPNLGLVDRLLAPMCAGDIIAGVAFAHLRRTGPAAIRARRVGDGWQLDGHAPWATSWGIADWFCVAAVSDDADVVWVRIPGVATPGCTPTPLALPVFGATGTVALTFDGHLAAADDVVGVENLDRWRAADRRRAALGQPAVLGIVERSIQLLEKRGDDQAMDAAARLRTDLGARWMRDTELVEALRSDDAIEAAGDHRAQCLHLARRSTTALLAASGGGGMDLSHPAQRLAREADFYVIQAQTADGRAATLRSI